MSSACIILSSSSSKLKIVLSEAGCKLPKPPRPETNFLRRDLAAVMAARPGGGGYVSGPSGNDAAFVLY